MTRHSAISIFYYPDIIEQLDTVNAITVCLSCNRSVGSENLLMVYDLRLVCSDCLIPELQKIRAILQNSSTTISLSGK